MDNLIYWLGLIILLLVINNTLIKYSFCLDNPVQNEKHKILLSLENKVPLSGFFFFVPIRSGRSPPRSSKTSSASQKQETHTKMNYHRQ